ncbi:MAG: D-tyrosyl-tRNA(Tyr) deacylase [Polaromonas sp.]|nr:D-tyrosyl-tRNA(Tyr) deacylase [Polaromonas sp.]
MRLPGPDNGLHVCPKLSICRHHMPLSGQGRYRGAFRQGHWHRPEVREPAKRQAGMKALLQRVSQASVVIAGDTVGRIGQGLLVLVCAERGDTEAEAARLLAKILKLRIFADEAGKMNRSVQDLDGQGGRGGLLVVSQFTLAADVSGGNRPSFTGAAAPDVGRRLYDCFVAQALAAHGPVQTGRFGADMQVHLVNDGPVTIALRIDPPG